MYVVVLLCWWAKDNFPLRWTIKSYNTIQCISIDCVRLVCDTSSCSRRGAARSVCDPLYCFLGELWGTSLFKTLANRGGHHGVIRCVSGIARGSVTCCLQTRLYINQPNLQHNRPINTKMPKIGRPYDCLWAPRTHLWNGKYLWRLNVLYATSIRV